MVHLEKLEGYLAAAEDGDAVGAGGEEGEKI
jgi:hypothetical protein